MERETEVFVLNQYTYITLHVCGDKRKAKWVLHTLGINDRLQPVIRKNLLPPEQVSPSQIIRWSV